MPNFSKDKIKKDEQMYVTAQVLLSEKNNDGKLKKLEEIAIRVGKLKHCLWDKYGSLRGWNLDIIALEKHIRTTSEFELIQQITGGITGKYFTRNTYACLKDIVMYQEACKVKIIKAIYTKYQDKETRKELSQLLNKGNIQELINNPWLHTQLRKVFFRGRTWKQNQFVLSKEQYNLQQDSEGKLWLAISTLEKNKRIKLLLKGKCQIDGELRIVHKNNNWFLQYSKIKPITNDLNRKETCGVDRGYTEVFATSGKKMLGNRLGLTLTIRQEKLDAKMKKRNKLFALRKNYLKQNKHKKADNILKNNLGKKKLESERSISKDKVRNIITKACQDLTKEYKTIVYEDLTTPIDNTKPMRRKTKNNLAHWTKGEVIKWLEHIAKLRGSQLTAVNPAYTSQTCSLTKCLTGTRKGDKFYRHTGEVVQADYNAAQNILDRSCDKVISLYTPYKKVKEILLARTDRYFEQCGKDCTKTLEPIKVGQSVSELA